MISQWHLWSIPICLPWNACVPSSLKSCSSLTPLHFYPQLQLALGLPQPSPLPLPPQACPTTLQVGETNSLMMMGNLTVSNGFPSSHLAPLYSPGLSQESCNTSLSTTHFTFSPSPLLYPNHLPFGDSLPVPKPDSHFWIVFVTLEDFWLLPDTMTKFLMSRTSWFLMIWIYLAGASPT